MGTRSENYALSCDFVSTQNLLGCTFDLDIENLRLKHHEPSVFLSAN